jgi:hypothetical protein
LSKPRVTEKWAESLGLDVSGKERWRIQLRLETTGVLPAVGKARAVTFFELDVTHEMWSVIVFCREKKPALKKASALFAWWADTGWNTRVGKLPLDAPKSLASVPKWLAAAEKKLGIAFHHDRPAVKSTVKGAAAALAKWIA